MTEQKILAAIKEGTYVWTKHSATTTQMLRKIVRLTSTLFIVAGRHEGYVERSNTDRYAREDGYQVGKWRHNRDFIVAIATDAEVEAQLLKETSERNEQKRLQEEREARVQLIAGLTAGFEKENIIVSDSWNRSDGLFSITITELTQSQVKRLQTIFRTFGLYGEAK